MERDIRDNLTVQSEPPSKLVPNIPFDVPTEVSEFWVERKATEATKWSC